ncbi:MAG: aldo/keto reductase [Gammaproteobacteria bacterium]|nr:aldo/keto reductase [Gammaproteobacteria bacterium]MDH5176095.1 aldo/keto reductase [Gammaproteobacteria bacterium]MDH5226503.1 aldo/keto reductase [Gammaproteobacteria bacterium]
MSSDTDITANASLAGHITLGGDLRVPRLGLGAMHLTGNGVWGPPRDPAAARRVLQRAVALGVRFIDTADSYGPAVSEAVIADALHPYPADLVIATKGGIVRPDQPTWASDGRPEHLTAACEASLRRLKLDRIDLYQLHTIDPDVPLEDSIGALARLREQGKVRHVGVSNFDVDELERARRIVPVVSVQNRYNAADRSSDDVLDVCTRDGIAFLPWRPLALAAGDARHPARGRLEQAAKQHGWSVPQAALAWLLQRSPMMLPIPGTSNVTHLEELVAAAGFRLDD